MHYTPHIHDSFLTQQERINLSQYIPPNTDPYITRFKNKLTLSTKQNKIFDLQNMVKTKTDNMSKTNQRLMNYIQRSEIAAKVRPLPLARLSQGDSLYCRDHAQFVDNMHIQYVIDHDAQVQLMPMKFDCVVTNQLLCVRKPPPPMVNLHDGLKSKKVLKVKEEVKDKDKGKEEKKVEGETVDLMKIDELDNTMKDDQSRRLSCIADFYLLVCDVFFVDG